MELNFRLFNCDRTYSLDKVEALISKVTKKLSREPKVDQKYFALPRMKDLCNELNDGGKMAGYAVFVVHAHESRLSLNEENAGIGYAKLYRTLLSVTDGRVLIVIGGDDSYKENEHDESFLSKWAWRKICSQFTEDDMNGIKSFIFSWDDNHNPIHEEALEFYLDPKNAGQKFVPLPKPKKIQSSNAELKCKDPSRAATEQKQSLNKEFPPQNNQGRSLPSMQPTALQTPTKDVRSLAQTDPLGYLAYHQEPQSKTNKPPLDQDLFSQANQGRSLPLSPKGDVSSLLQPVNTGTAADPLGHSAYQQQQPELTKTSAVQLGIIPTVHILPFLYHKEYRQAALDVLREVFKSINFSSSNIYVPDIPIEHLSYHYKTTKTDYIVLVSEYGDFMDLRHLPQKLQQLRGLFESIKESEGTKLIFVVTGNTSYREGDLSSDTVDQNALNLNNDIIKTGKLMVLSWNRYPCRVHREVLQEQLRCSRDCAILGKYRPIERLGPRIGAASVPAARRLLKIAEVHASDTRHRSLQVFSYHSSQESFSVVHKFIQGQLGIECKPSKKMEPETMLQQITYINPEFVVFSTDMNLFEDIKAVEEIIYKYGGLFHPLIANLKGIVLLLLGDNDCIDGNLTSSKVTGYVQHFTSKISLDPNKLTVMSWKSSPFVRHHDEMIRLLVRSQRMKEAPPVRDPREQFVKVPPVDNRRRAEGIQFDQTKGYLRYRAHLVHGRVHEVLYCHPPGWSPDQADLNFLSQRHADEPKAVLEFWADSPDGPTKPPVVISDEKSVASKLKKFFFSSSKDDSPDYYA